MTGKELCEQEEWSNAKSLYARCLGLFKNVTRVQRDQLTEADQAQRTEILVMMCLNSATCLLKRQMPKEAAKYCHEALGYQETSPKAHYRLYQALRANNDLDNAKTSLEQAIKLMP